MIPNKEALFKLPDTPTRPIEFPIAAWHLPLLFILSEMTVTKVAKNFLNCDWSMPHEHLYGALV